MFCRSVKPCAIKIASVHPSAQDASSSSARRRRRWGLGRRLRPCLDAAVIGIRSRWAVARGARFGIELVYLCSEHIENAEASRARVRLLVHNINSELRPLGVDVHCFDRSAFRDAIKVVRECSSGVISARQLHMPRRFDGHRLCTCRRNALMFFLRPAKLWRIHWRSESKFLLSGGRRGRIFGYGCYSLIFLAFFWRPASLVYSCCVLRSTGPM